MVCISYVWIDEKCPVGGKEDVNTRGTVVMLVGCDSSSSLSLARENAPSSVSEELPSTEPILH
jgi:hypothetical protein